MGKRHRMTHQCLSTLFSAGLCRAFFLSSCAPGQNTQRKKRVKQLVTLSIGTRFLRFFSKLPLLAIFAAGVIGRSDSVTFESNYTQNKHESTDDDGTDARV